MPEGFDAAFCARYDDVRRLARARLSREQAAVSTGTLVHEVYLSLCRREDLQFDTREQLLAYASQAMRTLLVDMARHRLARRRHAELVPLTEGAGVADDGAAGPETQLAMAQALQRLGELEPRLLRVAELRAVLGLPLEEIAEVLGVSVPTVKRDWQRARAFLYDALASGPC